MSDFENELSGVLSKPNVPLCVFVGSGVSSASGNKAGHRPDGWDGLVNKLETQLGLTGQPSEWTLPLRMEAVAAAAKAREKAEREDLTELVREAVNGPAADLAEPNKVHQALLHLNPSVVVTTNFDTLIERSLISSEPESVGYNVWAYPSRILRTATEMEDYPWVDSATLGDLLKCGAPLIAKIHGSLNHEKSSAEGIEDSFEKLVITESGYRRAYSTAPVKPFLEAVFATHQVIFIGYSLRDTEVRQILSGMGTIRSMNFPHIFFQKEYSVARPELRNYYREEFGLIFANLESYDHMADSLNRIEVNRTQDPFSLM